MPDVSNIAFTFTPLTFFGENIVQFYEKTSHFTE